MTYILYNCTTNGVPNGDTSILKISEFTTVEETLASAGLEESDVRVFSGDDFSNSQLHFKRAFRFGTSNSVTFDLEAARAHVTEQVRRSKKFFTNVPGSFAQEILVAQASLDEADRIPAVQAYFDAINTKAAELTAALDTIAAATTAEVLRSYIDE